jgi:hypothetical protein
MLALHGAAQVPAQNAFRIVYKDKAGSSAANLSPRALERRTNKAIALDSTDKPVSPTYIANTLSLTEGKLHLTSRWLNYAVILLTDSSKILALAGEPYIDTIIRVGYYSPGLYKMTGEDEAPGNAPITTAKTTGGEDYYGATYNQTKMVSGDYLHDRGYKGEGMLIAILDDGYYQVNTNRFFDSLRTSGRIVDAHNFVKNTDDVYDAPGHGTQCLSTMAAYVPGEYVGAAPLASYALYVTEKQPEDQPLEMDNLVAALERADSIGADVISASVGYNGMIPAFPSVTLAEIDGKTTIAAKGVNLANNKGMFCVITAGNDGATPWKKILTPGDADSALTVGWVNENRVPDALSGYGPNAGGRRKPDVCLLGTNVKAIVDGVINSPAGTSFSTPQMAGWAACLLQASSKSTSMYTLRTAVHKSAHLYDTPDDNQLGYGVPDFYKASEILGLKDTPAGGGGNSQWVIVRTNPVQQQLDMAITLPQNGDVQIGITDVSGKLIYKTTQRLQKGEQRVMLDMPQITPGIYFVKVIAGDQHYTAKIVKR